jgi:hypothetical protein
MNTLCLLSLYCALIFMSYQANFEGETSSKVYFSMFGHLFLPDDGRMQRRKHGEFHLVPAS